ncbi:MAG: flagellar biosynthesis anti-sigma factor FlgM [Desulfobacterales bacterium]
MEITEKNPNQIPPYINQVQQSSQTIDAENEKGRTPATGADSVDLSRNARDLLKAQQALHDVLDIRQEKVDALKQRVENGTYDIQPDKIAARMMKESLSNDLF